MAYAAEDMLAVTRWAAAHAAELGGDAAKISVGGRQRGGNLAAVTAVMARDHGSPAIAAQLLLYPVIAADFDTASYRGTARASTIPARHCSGTGISTCRARRSPASVRLTATADLTGLPPSVIVLAGHDPCAMRASPTRTP